MARSSEEHIQQEQRFGARNYNPLPVVIARAEGVWVHDVEGKRYLDCLAAYSAMNHGHCHPRLVAALREQAGKVTLTSRAFLHEWMGPFFEKVARYTGMDRTLPMNTGAEAVETAIKTARKWGYTVKGVPDEAAEILVYDGNFHGRTTTIVSFSEGKSRKHFGPYTPGFVKVPYGDLEATRGAVTENTVGILVEPIQGEGGVIVPPEGFLQGLRELCDAENLLLLADEIQTGLGRTGRRFCLEHEGVRPDVYVLGKALGGGVFPVSAVTASDEVLGVFHPGEHGSTFGGNPLGCAVACEALDVLEEERLVERSAELGERFMQGLRALRSPHVREVRGRGLMVAVEIREESGPARPFCKALMDEGLLCKDTHQQAIRFTPPLVITEEEVDWALERIGKVLAA